MRNNQEEAAIIFIDFKKAFDSVNINKHVGSSCVIPEKIVKAIQITYENTSAVVLTPEGEITTFKINTGVLQGGHLAPYLFIIAFGYALRTAIDDREGLTLTRRRRTRQPASHLYNLDYADDIALFADTIQEAELLLHQVESASKSFGLFLNPSKTKYMPSANNSVNFRKYRILNISDPTQIHSMTSSAEKPRHGRKFTPLTKFGERPSADSPN